MSESSDTKRVAKNTLMLYFRQILILVVSLYTVRVVLRVLGAEDYGIYNVVAGVVTMFSFMSNSMAAATQRFFSVDLGKKDESHLCLTFNVTLQIFLFLIIIIVLLSETIGIWFINNKLVIPVERMLAANWIYQGAIISFIFSILSSPFMAVIIAHENMNVYAYVSVVEVVLKLVIVFLLQAIPFDKLIVYGILLMIISIIITVIYMFYCIKCYKECRFKFIFNKECFTEIISYSGWNLFGSIASIIKNQIMNILLNIFFGPIVNAARGIASQVSNSVASFANNFGTALKPQIIKNYATGKKNECYQLVYSGCKFTYFLMYFFTLPLVLEMNFVLTLWLKTPPENVSFFTQLVLFDVLLDCMTQQIMTIVLADGRIKFYQIIVGGLLIMNLPISYICLKLGTSASSVFIVSIVITICAGIARLFFSKYLTGISIKEFIKKTVFPCVLVTVISSILPSMICFYMKDTVGRFFIVGTVSVIMTVVSVLFIGLNRRERELTYSFLLRRLKK